MSKKISELNILPSGSIDAQNDYIPIIHAGDNYRIPIQGFARTYVTNTFTENLTITGSVFVTGSVVADNFKMTSSAVNGGVVFTDNNGVLNTDSNLVWDNTNKRLGIGTNSPTTKLLVVGAHVPGIGLAQLSSVSAGSDAWLTFDAAPGHYAGFFFKNNGTTRWYLYNDISDKFTLEGVSGVVVLTALNNGNVGIGINSPTAFLHLKAGTSTANTAPLKFTAGTNLTVPENGAMEYDGTNLYFTTGGSRKSVALVSGNVGDVTKYQLSLKRNSSFVVNSSTIDNPQTFIYDVIDFSTFPTAGSEYNTTTGVFTAPLAGIYLVHYNVMVLNTGVAQLFRITNSKNGRGREDINFGLTNANMHLSTNFSIKLNANETMTLRIENNSSQVNATPDQRWTWATITYLGNG